MNPVILLSGGTSAAANGTPAWSLNQNYADNIRRAGGIPLLAVNNDCAEEYADLADGLLLSGGKDVAPALYGEELKYDFVITDPLRDDLEWKLIKAFVDRKKPIFGICRGVQVLNAYFGGTLYQDIPDELGGEHAKGVCHPVTLKKDSILGRLFGESLEINSYHHQGIRLLAPRLTAEAHAPDGLVEAVSCPDHPFMLAVPWHPEFSFRTDEASRAIFRAFAARCM